MDKFLRKLILRGIKKEYHKMHSKSDVIKEAKRILEFRRLEFPHRDAIL